MSRKLSEIDDPFTLLIKEEYRLEVPEVEEGVRIPQQKKQRGQNKAKERMVSRAVDSIKLCFATANGETCEKENCKFSHDTQEYLKIKGPDIGDMCPLIAEYGTCKYGIKCRFFNSHSDPKWKEISESETDQIKNVISRESQKTIRSKKMDLSKSKEFEKIWNEKEQVHLEKIEGTDEQSDMIIKLRPAEKKKIDFRGKSYLAPLTTVGNLPFRRICKGFGVDITCAEMALAGNLLAGSQNEWALLKRHKSEDLFGIQITGNHPSSFAHLCDVLNQNIETDFVDINLGCPVEAITSKGCGSALMEKRSRLKGIVLAANYILDCPVTVKLRTGIAENKPFAHRLVPLFQEWGVAAVTLHGRSKAQRYTKLADWDYIVECSKTVERSAGMAFIGNGDIFNPDEYLTKLREQQTVDGMMIGRGALIKPWIFQEINSGQLYDISSSERLEILKDFASYGMQLWGTDTMTRRFLCEWLSFLHRYVPVGLLEVLPQRMNLRPQKYFGRNELETLMASDQVNDWIKLSEMVLGPAPETFSFIPKYISLIQT